LRVVSGNDEEIYTKFQTGMTAKLFAVRMAVREELAIDDPTHEKQKKE
jgi:hypothetical protein